MNKELVELCSEYVECYKVVLCLLEVNGIESERLKLFRIMQDRMSILEKELFELLVGIEC